MRLPLTLGFVLGSLLVGCASDGGPSAAASVAGAGGGAGATTGDAVAPGSAGEARGGVGAAGAPAPDCGDIAAPHAWGDWPMPNPAGSGLPHPASYTWDASGQQVTDNVTGLVWQREVPPPA